MAKSQQLGWLVLKGKRWYGYYRKQVLDPETEDVRVSIVPIRLGLRSQMTKGTAHAAQTGLVSCFSSAAVSVSQ